MRRSSCASSSGTSSWPRTRSSTAAARRRSWRGQASAASSPRPLPPPPRVDAVSFLASAGFLGRIAPAEPPPEPPEPGHVTAGVRYVRGSPIVFYELASCAMVNFFNFAYFAIFLLYATRELHVRAGTLGVVLGAAAVGSLIGAAVTGRIANRIGVGPAFCLGIVLFPAPLILVPLAGGPHALVLACLFLAEFGSGVGVMILDIAAGS